MIFHDHTPGELLRRLLEHFWLDKDGVITWDNQDGVSLNEVEEPWFITELEEYMPESKKDPT